MVREERERPLWLTELTPPPSPRPPQVDLQRTFTFRNSKQTYTGIPVIAANMDTTGTFEMARVLAKVRSRRPLEAARLLRFLVGSSVRFPHRFLCPVPPSVPLSSSSIGFLRPVLSVPLSGSSVQFLRRFLLRFLLRFLCRFLHRFLCPVLSVPLSALLSGSSVVPLSGSSIGSSVQYLCLIPSDSAVGSSVLSGRFLCSSVGSERSRLPVPLCPSSTRSSRPSTSTTRWRSGGASLRPTRTAWR